MDINLGLYSNGVLSEGAEKKDDTIRISTKDLLLPIEIEKDVVALAEDIFRNIEGFYKPFDDYTPIDPELKISIINELNIYKSENKGLPSSQILQVCYGDSRDLTEIVEENEFIEEISRSFQGCIQEDEYKNLTNSLRLYFNVARSYELDEMLSVINQVYFPKIDNLRVEFVSGESINIDVPKKVSDKIYDKLFIIYCTIGDIRGALKFLDKNSFQFDGFNISRVANIVQNNIGMYELLGDKEHEFFENILKATETYENNSRKSLEELTTDQVDVLLHNLRSAFDEFEIMYMDNYPTDKDVAKYCAYMCYKCLDKIIKYTRKDNQGNENSNDEIRRDFYLRAAVALGSNRAKKENEMSLSLR